MVSGWHSHWRSRSVLLDHAGVWLAGEDGHHPDTDARLRRYVFAPADTGDRARAGRRLPLRDVQRGFPADVSGSVLRHVAYGLHGARHEPVAAEYPHHDGRRIGHTRASLYKRPDGHRAFSRSLVSG